MFNASERAAAFIGILGRFAIVFLLSTSALAGTFVSSPDRRDFAFDEQRRVLYISTLTSGIQRFNVDTSSFLPSFGIAGNFYGLDLSPDGNFLAVADLSVQYVPPTGQFWLIDLRTNESTRKTFAIDSGETGAWSVAWGADENLYFSVNYQGSGWTPIRRWNRATDTFEVIAPSANQMGMLSASFDRNLIAWVEPNNSSGPVGTYDVLTGTVLRTESYTNGTGWFNFEVATNDNGSRVLVPTYNGMYRYDEALNRTGPVYGAYAGVQPIGAAYLPGSDIVFMPMAATNRIRAVNSNSWTLIAEYAAPSNFDTTGNFAYVEGRIKITRGQEFVITTVEGGLQINRLKPSALSQSVTTNFNQPKAITLGAVSEAVSPLFTYAIVTSPSNGQLSGVGGSLTYSPTSGHCCNDSFAFTVSDGVRTSDPAWVDVQIAPPLPTASPLSLSLNEDSNAALVLPGNSNGGGTLSYEILSLPTNGSLAGVAPNFTYVPNEGYFGSDSFSFKVANQYGESAPASVSLNIVPVNDRPFFSLTTSSISVKKNSGAKSYPGFATNLQPGWGNEIGQSFTFAVQVDDPTFFSVQPAISSSGTLTFTPSKKQGQTRLSITMKDSGGTANGGIDISLPSVVQFISTP